jgi:putative ABC transport system permease protein
MLLTGVGLGVGVAAAIVMTRLISGLLFGISATDFSTFALLSGLLATIALIACWWPAHRASQVDPIITLRSE